VVIPKKLRDALGIEPGDDITFWLHDDHVALCPTHTRAALRGRFEGVALTEILEKGRSEDRAHER